MSDSVRQPIVVEPADTDKKVTEMSEEQLALLVQRQEQQVERARQIAENSRLLRKGQFIGTENPLDLAINGEGFFAVDDPFIGRVYSKFGQFGLDYQGKVTDIYGRVLQGFLVDDNGNITGALGPLQLPLLGSSMEPKQTNAVSLTVNLDAASMPPAAAFVPGFNPANPPASTTYNNSTSIQVYDSLGCEHIMTVYFVKLAAERTWQLHVGVDGIGCNLSEHAGSLIGTMTGTLQGSSDNIEFSFDPATGAVSPQGLTLNMQKSTSFSAPFSIHAITQNGYPTGALRTLQVEKNGVIKGWYANGRSKTLGQVALTAFADPRELVKQPNFAWQESERSGVAVIGAPLTANLGSVESAYLEQLVDPNLPKENAELEDLLREFASRIMQMQRDARNVGDLSRASRVPPALRFSAAPATRNVVAGPSLRELAAPAVAHVEEDEKRPDPARRFGKRT